MKFKISISCYIRRSVNCGGEYTVTSNNEDEEIFKWFVSIILIWVIPIWKEYFGANFILLSWIETKDYANSGSKEISTGEPWGSLKGGIL